MSLCLTHCFDSYYLTCALQKFSVCLFFLQNPEPWSLLGAQVCCQQEEHRPAEPEQQWSVPLCPHPQQLSTCQPDGWTKKWQAQEQHPRCSRPTRWQSWKSGAHAELIVARWWRGSRRRCHPPRGPGKPDGHRFLDCRLTAWVGLWVWVLAGPATAQQAPGPAAAGPSGQQRTAGEGPGQAQVVQLPRPAAALPEGLHLCFYSGAHHPPAEQAHQCLQAYTDRPITSGRSVCRTENVRSAHFVIFLIRVVTLDYFQ